MTIFAPFEAFYLDSMLFNSDAAGASVDVVAETVEAIEQRSAVLADLDQDELLNHLQNIVLHAAALSRYFWPARSGHEERGEQLRVAFDVTDASPLKSRDLRNALEHFDERLDRYLETNVVGHILPRYVGPVPRDNSIPVHLFRAYFIDRGVFALLGQEYEMQPLVDEIGRIHNLIVAAVQKGSRLPSNRATGRTDLPHTSK